MKTRFPRWILGLFAIGLLILQQDLSVGSRARANLRAGPKKNLDLHQSAKKAAAVTVCHGRCGELAIRREPRTVAEGMFQSPPLLASTTAFLRVDVIPSAEKSTGSACSDACKD